MKKTHKIRIKSLDKIVFRFEKAEDVVDLDQISHLNVVKIFVCLDEDLSM